jgi:hypothetical protein
MPGQQATQASWVETHNVTTDDFGTVGVTVGKGTKAGGIAAQFKDVNFAAVHYWLKVEIKEGGNYRELSYTQLTSMPYAEVATNAAIPTGTVSAFAGDATKIPAGWLLCDGREISRSEYSALYNAIGAAWGHGNNSTTFNLPDMRGLFLRGVSGNSNNDADAGNRTIVKEGGNTGNKVGSYQGDAISHITGQRVSSLYFCTGAFYGITTHTPNGFSSGGLFGAWGTGMFDASRVVPVGSDNRPKNVNVNYIIKY